jgi:hypothetical protein
MFFTMNEQDKFDDELLRKFINPGLTEKAPEGFTSKTATRIKIEAQSVNVRPGFFARNTVPIISITVFAILVIAAVIIPAHESGSVGSVVWNYINSSEFKLLSFNNNIFAELNLPVWTKYSAIILLMIVFFDKALFRIFHREQS